MIVKPSRTMRIIPWPWADDLLPIGGAGGSFRAHGTVFRAQPITEII
jgi:hypothetical protein